MWGRIRGRGGKREREGWFLHVFFLSASQYFEHLNDLPSKSPHHAILSLYLYTVTCHDSTPPKERIGWNPCWPITLGAYRIVRRKVAIDTFMRSSLEATSSKICRGMFYFYVNTYVNESNQHELRRNGSLCSIPPESFPSLLCTSMFDDARDNM